MVHVLKSELFFIFIFFYFSVSDFLMGEQDMVLSESAMSKQHSRVCRFYCYHYYPE